MENTSFFFNFFLSLQPPRWPNQENDCYQVNLCRSLTHLPIFIVLVRPKAPNSPKHWNSPTPQLPKESGFVPIIPIKYLELVLILPIWFHPDLSTLSFFQDIRFPRFLFSPSNLLYPRIQFELKMEHLRHNIFLHIKFH